MKMQVAFRDTGHVQNGLKTVISVGFMEWSKDSYLEAPDGMIGKFAMGMVSENGLLRPSLVSDFDEYRMPIDEYGHPPCLGNDVTKLITTGVWNSPPYKDYCELHMTRCLLEPSSEGNEVLLFGGMVAVPRTATVDTESVFQLGMKGSRFFYEGRIGVDLRPEWGNPEMAARTRGCALRDYFRLPVWGFGDEPVGLQWVGSLADAAELQEYRDLFLRERDEYDDRRLEALQASVSEKGLDNLGRDQLFATCMRRLADNGLVHPITRPLTQAQTAEQNEGMRLVLADVLEENASNDMGMAAGFR